MGAPKAQTSLGLGPTLPYKPIAPDVIPGVSVPAAPPIPKAPPLVLPPKKTYRESNPYIPKYGLSGGVSIVHSNPYKHLPATVNKIDAEPPAGETKADSSDTVKDFLTKIRSKLDVKNSLLALGATAGVALIGYGAYKTYKYFVNSGEDKVAPNGSSTTSGSGSISGQSANSGSHNRGSGVGIPRNTDNRVKNLGVRKNSRVKGGVGVGGIALTTKRRAPDRLNVGMGTR